MLYWIVYVHVEATTMSKLSQRTLFKVGFEWWSFATPYFNVHKIKVQWKGYFQNQFLVGEIDLLFCTRDSFTLLCDQI